MAKFQGVVKWFNNAKGFGFLGSKTGTDIFVHYSNIVSDGPTFKTLKEGDAVEWDVQNDDQGRPQAVRVHVTGGKLSSGMPENP